MTDRRGILGSVSARGDRWLAQLPPSLGRRGKLRDTEDAAWQWLREENAKATLGLTGGVEPQRTPVAELIRVWLAGKIIKETTRIDYQIRIDTHVAPHPVGALAIGDVLGMHVDKILKDTPPNWTRIHVAKILSSFFEWAEGNRFTVGNPYRQSQAKTMCQLMYRSVEPRDSTENVWTPEQLLAFIRHEPSPVYRDYWMFVAATGARRGEAIGATWPNIHAEAGWCWLADNVSMAGREIVRSETPKNWKRRKAYFGPIIGEMLLARKAEQDAYRESQPAWADSWVFDRRRGWGPRFRPGTHLAPATVTERFNRHARELGLPPLAGPHGLRRTFATVAEEGGFKPSVRTAALGHTPDIGGRYTKASEADMRAFAERLAALLLLP